MNIPPDPLDSMQTALQNADKANLRLMLAFDFAVSMGQMNGIIPTNVLLALDHARECAAALFQYLPAPAMKEAGPTEDQHKQAYLDDFLTVGEYDELVKR